MNVRLSVVCVVTSSSKQSVLHNKQQEEGFNLEGSNMTSLVRMNSALRDKNAIFSDEIFSKGIVNNIITFRSDQIS